MSNLVKFQNTLIFSFSQFYSSQSFITVLHLPYGNKNNDTEVGYWCESSILGFWEFCQKHYSHGRVMQLPGMMVLDENGTVSSLSK